MHTLSMQELGAIRGGNAVRTGYHAVMDLPIGGDKHVRNIPLEGPFDIAGGLAMWEASTIRRGATETSQVWNAP